MTHPTILITGAARRVGRALALHFGAAQWHVLVHYDHAEQEAQATAASIRAAGGKADLLQVHFQKLDDADILFEKAQHILGAAPHVIINNAAVFEPEKNGPSHESRQKHRLINTDIPIRLAEALAATATNGTCVINMLDGTLDANMEHFPSYAESKKALEEWTLATHSRYAPKFYAYGIKIGPTIRNERESEQHFAAVAAASPRRAPTPLAAICETALRMARGLEAAALIDLA